MAHKTATIQLADFAEAGFDPAAEFSSSPHPSGAPILRAIGECFAFRGADLTAEAQGLGKPWHQWLLELVVAGLWEDKPGRSAFVCYTIHPAIIRVFFCSRQKRFPSRFHQILSRSRAYIENGQDGFPPERARPVALWEPPASMFALWPKATDGEHSGARVVDTGNLLAWFSYPASQHDHSIALEKAGPDYVRVPQEDSISYNLNGRDYHYFNRWCSVDGALELR